MAPPREYPYRLQILLLLTQVTLATDNLSLEVVSYNSSVVDLACRYEGNKNNLFFNIYKQSDACIFYKGNCQYYPQNNCKFQCKESDDKGLTFSVELSGNCQERIHIRCSVRSLAEGQELELDAVHTLLAQSDSPEISIGDEKPVVILEQVPIECTVANRCNQTKLEISGAHLADLKIDHTRQESRFSTTAKTTAIFDTAGNFTITCKEADKGPSFSSFQTIAVQSTFASQDGPPRANGATSFKLPLIIGVSLTALVLTIGGVVFTIFWLKKRKIYLKPERGDMEEAKVLLDKLKESRAHLHQERGDFEKSKRSMAQSSNYMKIENLILQLNSANIKKNTEKIMNLLNDEKTTFPTDGKPLIYYLTEKLNDLYHEPSIIVPLMKRVIEISNMPELYKMEDLIEIIWEKFGKGIEKITEERRCIQKLKILLPFDSQLRTRLLWKFVENAVDIPDERHPWAHHADVLHFLISEGANPFFLYDETSKKDSQSIGQTSAFALFLEKYEQAQSLSLIKPCLEAVISRWDQVNSSKSVLNDVVKSFPSINHLLGIKEQLSRIIEKIPFLCDHVDGDGRTPLHNLMRKIFIDGIGWSMPETDSLENLEELTMQLTTEENVNMYDIDDVTPYSWILFELVSSNDVSSDVLYSQNTESLTKVDGFFGRKEAKKGRAVRGFNVVSYWKIYNVIDKMKSASAKFILDILQVWKITYPEKGRCIMSKVIEKSDDFYEEPSFAKLIKALYPSYRCSSLYGEEKFAKLIWNEIKPFTVDDKSTEKMCINKLKFFIDLQSELPIRLLKRCAELPENDTWNPHFVNVVIFLVKAGADRNESILNDIVKSITSLNHLCNIKEPIFDMIDKNPELCNHLDSKERTPLHNFMKNFVDSAEWYTSESNSLVNAVDLAKKLTTSFNINLHDKEHITPYTWFCLGKKSIQESQNSKIMVEIEDHFQKKRALKEEALKEIKGSANKESVTQEGTLP